MKHRSYTYVAILSLTALLVACGTPSHNQDDGSTVNTVIGVAGCNGCTAIKTFTSQTIASQLYAVKDGRNMNTGQRISASLQLGITNRTAGLKDGLSASSIAISYLPQIIGPDAHLFDGEVLPTDTNHRYRFLLRIHHNSSFSSEDVYLAEGDTKYVLLPPVVLEGLRSEGNCFSSGCVWDDDYVLSAKVVNSHMATGTPLTIFVGSRVSRQVASKDGLNSSYETVNAGALLNVKPEQLKGFVTAVRQRLGIN